MPTPARTKYKAQVTIVIKEQNTYGDIENNSVLTYESDLQNVGSLSQLGAFLERMENAIENPKDNPYPVRAVD